MFGSIYIGLSGLTAYSRGLQQISNNIANLNSQGFRSSNVTFRDSFGVRNQGVSYSSNGQGSGHGVMLGGSQLNFSQGAMQQTGRNLDLAIDGSGFFMLMRGDEVLYTRTGSFEVDPDGHIVLAGTDYRLATLDPAGQPVSLSVDSAQNSAPRATTKVTMANNLSFDAPSHSISNVKVYDARGGAHLWKIDFAKITGQVDQWTVTVTEGTTAIGTPQTLKFENGVVHSSTRSLTFASEAGLSVALDFTNAVSSSSGLISTLSAGTIDGYGAGTATALAVNEAGQLEITYSNSQKTQLGAVAIADFRDPQALTQRSGGLFSDGGGARRELFASSDPRVGDILSGQLEASNVDLSKEFGDLILIQRGFQASSQIVSVTNDMIQQLFGIRGQG